MSYQPVEPRAASAQPPARPPVAATGALSETAVPYPCRLATAIVAAMAGLNVDALLDLRRSTAPVSMARQIAMYLAHVGLGLSQAGVAQAFRRDRSTVAYACRRIEDLRDDPAFDHRVAQMEACLRWATER
ncbi:helix-turn-helix domain-containing protein [Xanthobacter oligotrophicus]|uniref:helix-turn-helix domain-containing protein n=1 Tax=Xanthobacter oligotrophicus TaxID=2607286 RepID=UPI001E3150D6|nr:helix-turn-helix domain-containing protein [Xanthobacter oligotrophicus]MCG5235159.1 DNA replication initiation protein [Xanthobacter oligotrophicus]